MKKLPGDHRMAFGKRTSQGTEADSDSDKNWIFGKKERGSFAQVKEMGGSPERERRASRTKGELCQGNWLL